MNRHDGGVISTAVQGIYFLVDVDVDINTCQSTRRDICETVVS